jgi:tripartite-type tricarboxylate transporter receptor subunit TctC
VASTARNPDHAVVQKLNATLATILADADFQRTLASQGIEIRGGSPRELSAQMARDIEKWAGVIKHANIRID